MPNLIDLTGQRFDKLVVLEKAPSRKRHVYWKCQCDCGNICEVSGEFLRRKNIPRDCGCTKQKNIKAKRIEEKNNWLVGKQFGKLTVCKPTSERINRSIVWECKCECGNIKYVPTHLLTSNHTRSCGCLIREVHGNDLTNQRFGKLTALYPREYKKNSSIIWHCKCDCGRECDVESYSLRAGLIKSCGCIASSIGELNIEQILLDNNISYKKEYTFDDLKGKRNRFLRFDFGILKDNILIRLIEFDGQQHYSIRTGIWGESEESLIERQHRDKEKNEYALSHNIPLVRIPYWERDNITLEMLMGDKYLVS